MQKAVSTHLALSATPVFGAVGIEGFYTASDHAALYSNINRYLWINTWQYPKFLRIFS